MQCERNGKEQCFPAGPLHYGNPDTDLYMSVFSDDLGRLFIQDTMGIFLQLKCMWVNLRIITLSGEEATEEYRQDDFIYIKLKKYTTPKWCESEEERCVRF